MIVSVWTNSEFWTWCLCVLQVNDTPLEPTTGRSCWQRWSTTVPLCSTRTCCRRLPPPHHRAAGSHNSDLLVLPLALFLSCCCWPPHQDLLPVRAQRCFCWAGICFLRLSRGCRSNRLCFVYLLVSRRHDMALRWAIRVPFLLFYVLWGSRNFILVVNYVLFIFE
jgi:hypothetical protein